MSIQDRPIKVLLYEDKQDYKEAFINKARKARIITDHVDNVDDLFEKIESQPKKYQHLVLDARAYLHEGQQEGTEDEMNLLAILSKLQKLKYEHGIIIPYSINTGFSDLGLRLGQQVDCPIFEKGNETEKLFPHIWTEFEKTESAQLLFEYPEIFGLAFDRFDNVEVDVLSNLFKHKLFTAASISTRVNNLANLRRIMEHLMDVIHRDYLGSAPGIITSPGSRLREITEHIKDQEHFPPHIYGTITGIRKTASEFGSHTPSTPQEIEGYPSSDYITGLAISLKDVFRWAKTKLN